jgi:hypothetical protein
MTVRLCWIFFETGTTACSKVRWRKAGCTLIKVATKGSRIVIMSGHLHLKNVLEDPMNG